MGYTSEYRTPGEPLLDFFRKRFAPTNGEPYTGVLDLATDGFNTAYLAYRTPGIDGKIIGVVVLLRYGRDHEITYKEISEFEGPNERRCPRSILDQLDDLDDEDDPRGTARAWRADCHERLAARPKLRDGDVIRFRSPLRFGDGVTRDTFVYRSERTPRGGTRHQLYEAHEQEGGGYGLRRYALRVRIRRWRDRPLDKIGSIHAPAPQAPLPDPPPRAASGPATQGALFGSMGGD